MKLNGTLVRERRLQLGLTSRELADCSHCSITVIRRVEETGDVATLTVSTVAAMLDALSLTWSEAVLEAGSSGHSDSGIVERLGALLHNHKKGLPPHVAATYLATTLTDVTKAASALSVTLEPAGLRVHSGSTGLRLVAGASPVGDSVEEARTFTVLNHADLSLLRRIATRKVKSNAIANSNDGNVSLHKLRNCRLVTEGDGGRLSLTERTMRTLGLS